MKIFGNNRNWYKTVFQSSVILFLAYMGIRIWVDKTYVADFEAYCPFGGIQALGSYLTRDSLACSMNSNQIMMGVVLILGVILLSKLFCGYICPLGTISEWLGKLGEKFKIRFTVTGTSDKVLRLLKYVLLFTVFYFTLQSSELFCKKVDPYYAVTSGFNSDVVVLYSTIAILLLVLGSIFLRMFWCKYLCPLGAASNLFRFWWWIGGVLIVYVVLLRMGLDISYVAPLAVITAGGYILEVWKKEKVQPLFVKVTRNADSCIDCGLCSKKCPQGIDVASMESVAHVDCTLCGDCIAACPEDNTLQINKKNMRWLPALALVVLITAGFILGKTWEVPTIDIQWGTQEQINSAGIYSQTGLKNIKCYGSATAFANQIRNLNGIYGVAAYAGSHSVKIYYDERVWNEDKIKQRLFTPVKRVIEPIALEVDSVKRITITVDHFFDPLDVYYLQQLLLQESDACGCETEYACPVIVHLYFP
ncbi:MAG: 4Fe-4S binding protein, partial [Bacteroidales bacterium]